MDLRFDDNLGIAPVKPITIAVWRGTGNRIAAPGWQELP